MHMIQTLARPEVPQLPAYNAGLSSEAVRARYGVSEIARLASNENPYGASPAVARALADLATRVGCYPDANCSALRAAIGARTGVAPAAIVIGNGSEDILQMLCQAFLSAGERVLTQRPAFGLHEIYPRMMGAQVELLALTPRLGFDVEAWCAALARGLAARGARLILSGRNVAALEAVAKDCGAGTMILPFEATDYDAIPGLVERAWAWGGRIDGLVNNAGISQRSLAVETDFAVYQKIIAVDLLAPIALTQALLPRMIAAVRSSPYRASRESPACRCAAPIRRPSTASSAIMTASAPKMSIWD